MDYQLHAAAALMLTYGGVAMNDGNELNPAIGFALIALGGLVILSTVAVVLRYLSCWNRLERQYIAGEMNFGRSFGFQVFKVLTPFDPSGIITNFRWVFRIGTTEAGILFKTIFPLSFLFRSIQIPWGDFSIAPQDYIGGKRYELFLSKLPEIQIVLPRSVAERLLKPDVADYPSPR